MDIDADMVVSITWASFRRGLGLLKRELGLIKRRFRVGMSKEGFLLQGEP